MTATAGFLYGSLPHVYYYLLIELLAGMSLIIGSACTFNNFIDRDIDEKMVRTKKRVIVSGEVSGRNALIFASIIGVLGFLILFFCLNLLTFYIGIAAFIDYVVLYGYAKRHSRFGTEVGSVSGAAPILAGYTAVSGDFTVSAVVLFLILTFWQMPHFYAIAMFRLSDYKKAGIPVLPSQVGIFQTQLRIIVYVIAYILTCLALSLYGHTGIFFATLALVSGGLWLYFGLVGLKVKNPTQWARRMFLYSLIALLVVSITIPLGVLLP